MRPPTSAPVLPLIEILLLSSSRGVRGFFDVCPLFFFVPVLKVPSKCADKTTGGLATMPVDLLIVIGFVLIGALFSVIVEILSSRESRKSPPDQTPGSKDASCANLDKP